MTMERTLNARTYIALGGGFALGALCGYLVAKRQTAESAERRIAQEVDATKEHYRARIEELQRAHAVALANATGKGDNPLDGPAAVGDEPRSATDVPGQQDYYGVQGSGASVAGAETVLPGDPLDRIHDADAGDVSGVLAGHTPLDQAGPDGTGRKDPMEGLEPEDPDDAELEGPDAEPATGPLVRDETKPFVISSDEFFEPLPGFSQIEMTWYAGDGALIDEHENPIRNPYELCGNFAGQFGNGSDDDRIVYVRNRKLQVDFEIKLHDGSYVEEVLNYGKPK